MFKSMKQAANELDAIRNELARGRDNVDVGSLSGRCDTVGFWVAANGKQTGISAKLLSEASSLSRKLIGVSNRVEFTIGTPYQFAIFDAEEGVDCWWCDVVNASGDTVYAAGPASDAEQSRWIALDWINDA